MTAALLSGLQQRKADLDDNGKILFSEWLLFAKNEVPRRQNADEMSVRGTPFFMSEKTNTFEAQKKDFVVQHPLRDAILATNAHPGADTIIIPAGIYKLTINNKSDGRDARFGDLDIFDEVTILGSGAHTTIIDAGNINDRVFDVFSRKQVKISNLMMRGGNTLANQSGGGIRNSGKLHLHQIILKGNRSKMGGAIANVFTGVLVIHGSEIVDNKATMLAGGIFNLKAEITLQKSILSGNNAPNVSAAFNMGKMTLLDGVTVRNNSGAQRDAIRNDAEGILIGEFDEPETNVAIKEDASTDKHCGLTKPILRGGKNAS